MRPLLRPFVALSLLLLGAHPAYADGSVLGRNGGAASIASARVAVALGNEKTTRWLEVTVEGAEAGFLWVVPATKGAHVGTTTSEWLDGLEPSDGSAARAPRVGSSLPIGVALITDEATLEATVTARGVALSSDDQAAFTSAFEQGGGALVLEYPAGASIQTTGVVRIDEEGPLDLELPTTSHPSAPAKLFVLATDPVGVTDATGMASWLSDGEPATRVGDAWLTRGAGMLSSFHGRKVVVSLQPITDVLIGGSRGGAVTFVPDAGADASTGDPGTASVSPPPGTVYDTPVPPPPAAPGDDGSGADVAEGLADGVSDAASGCGGGTDDSDESGSGCDSSSGSSDSSSGCSSSSSSDSSSDCAVRGSRRHRNGVGVRILVFGAAALAWARRATRRKRAAG